MGTRGAIGHTTADGWQAVYSHNDSYPAGVGKTLWDAYHNDYYGDLARMAAELVDQHPAGWVSLAHRECFCHHRNALAEPFITDRDDPGLLWFAYILDMGHQQLRILHRKLPGWEPYALVDLRGPEPDWDRIGPEESEG